MMITATAVQYPYAKVVFSNGFVISYKTKHDPDEHDYKNAIAGAKIFNSHSAVNRSKLLASLMKD